MNEPQAHATGRSDTRLRQLALALTSGVLAAAVLVVMLWEMTILQLSGPAVAYLLITYGLPLLAAAPASRHDRLAAIRVGSALFLALHAPLYIPWFMAHLYGTA